MSQITINEEKCIGCGTCAALVPKVFELNDEMKAEVKDSKGDTQEKIESAVSACPVQAIDVK